MATLWRSNSDDHMGNFELFQDGERLLLEANWGEYAYTFDAESLRNLYDALTPLVTLPAGPGVTHQS